MRPLFYSDQDCRDRLKPGKPMFFNVYVDANFKHQRPSRSLPDRTYADYALYQRPWWSAGGAFAYRIVVKAKPTPSPDKEDAA